MFFHNSLQFSKILCLLSKSFFMKYKIPLFLSNEQGRRYFEPEKRNFKPWWLLSRLVIYYN
ncbi:MAG TPA: hypothetical protein DCY27_10220 [Desulfobacterales bacterium]|nr:hypothetical protein [Desulfobacterales bacterium]